MRDQYFSYQDFQRRSRTKTHFFVFTSSSLFTSSSHLSTFILLSLFTLLLQPLHPIDMAPRKRIKYEETSDDVTDNDTGESVVVMSTKTQGKRTKIAKSKLSKHLRRRRQKRNCRRKNRPGNNQWGHRRIDKPQPLALTWRMMKRSQMSCISLWLTCMQIFWHTRTWVHSKRNF